MNKSIFVAILISAISFVNAQEIPPVLDHPIETGSPAGPILVGPVITDPAGKYKLRKGGVNLRAEDGRSIIVPAGAETTLTLSRVAGWEVVLNEDEEGMTTKTLGDVPMSIESSEIYWVEFDSTGEFKEFETVRCYLRVGGYIIVKGKYDDINDRWHTARGLTNVPAKVTGE